MAISSIDSCTVMQSLGLKVKQVTQKKEHLAYQWIFVSDQSSLNRPMIGF